MPSIDRAPSQNASRLTVDYLRQFEATAFAEAVDNVPAHWAEAQQHARERRSAAIW